MNDKVVKHRNYFLLTLITIIVVILAGIGAYYYFDLSMDHTTIIEKGFIVLYKALLKGISWIADLF